MKNKLLKKLRNEGRNKITILSVTYTTDFRFVKNITGMKYSYDEPEYAGLFSFNDTEDDVKDKAMRIFFKKEMDWIRKRYKRYSLKYKIQKKGGAK